MTLFLLTASSPVFASSKLDEGATAPEISKALSPYINSKAACLALSYAFEAQTFFRQIEAEHDLDVSKFLPPLGQGNFGSQGLDAKKIAEYQAKHDQNPIFKTAYSFVLGQDLASFQSMNLLSGLLTLLGSEIDAKTVQTSIHKDFQILQTIKQTIRDQKIPRSKNFPLVTAYWRLSKLDKDETGSALNGSNWVLPRAIELIGQSPEICQGKLPTTITSENLGLPIVLTSMLYSARQILEASLFDTLAEHLDGIYPIPVAHVGQDVENLTRRLQLCTKQHLLMPMSYNFGGNFNKMRDYAYLGHKTYVRAYASSGGSLALPQHMGDCSSLTGAIIGFCQLKDKFVQHPLVVNRLSTYYIKLAYEEAILSKPLPSTLDETEKKILTQIKGVFSFQNQPPKLLDFVLQPGHISLCLGISDQQTMDVIELNRTDNPDQNFIQGLGFRSRTSVNGLALTLK